MHLLGCWTTNYSICKPPECDNTCMFRHRRLAPASPASAHPRRGGRLRTHWPGAIAALLIGIGAAVGIGAGQADPDNLGWWMLAGGLVAAVGAFLTLLQTLRPQPPSPASIATQPASPSPSPTSLPATKDRAAPFSEVDHKRVWNIRAPVRSFTGRDPELAAIADHLRSNQRAALVPALALYGMDGIGKTQLARAYAHTHRDRYQIGWWIPAETNPDRHHRTRRPRRPPRRPRRPSHTAASGLPPPSARRPGRLAAGL